MQGEKQYLESLFEKYQLGLVNEQEKEIIARWLVSLDVDESDLEDHQLELRGTAMRLRMSRQLFGSAAAPQRKKLFPQWLQVAAVFCVMVAAVWLMTGRYPIQQDKQQVQVRQDNPVSKHYVNRGVQPIRVVLPDTSSVVLYARGELTYRKDFGGKLRNVFLKGKAEFKVHKDASRAFTVYAGGVSTTALGTRFTVTALRLNQVKVQLSEGRVVVRSTTMKGLPIEDTYMKPNEELLVNRSSGAVQLSRKAPGMQQTKPTAGKGSDQIQMKFNQEALGSVFAKLQKAYQRRIIYDQAELDSLTFTGSVEPGDQFKNILQIICNMNNLNLHQEGDKIMIRKNTN